MCTGQQFWEKITYINIMETMTIVSTRTSKPWVSEENLIFVIMWLRRAMHLFTIVIYHIILFSFRQVKQGKPGRTIYIK